MSSAGPVLISDTNLSRAWARILIHVIKHGGTEISPLVLSISGLPRDVIPELDEIRVPLDKLLREKEQFEINTVANTIFPQSVWRIAGGDRHAFFDEYRETLPRFASVEKLNRNGTYFSRLVAFDLDARTGERLPHIPQGSIPENGNQLEHVIKVLSEGKLKRDSALQIAIFDPARDHTNAPYQSFPCMQHLTFIKGCADALSLNAFYATQQIVRKAYGNYLGLCRLGHFVASQTGLSFERLNVYVGSEKLGGFSKTCVELQPLISSALAVIEDTTDAREGVVHGP